MFGIIWTIVVIYICYRVYKQRMGNPPENNQRRQAPNPQGQIQTSPKTENDTDETFCTASTGWTDTAGKTSRAAGARKQMPQAKAQKSWQRVRQRVRMSRNLRWHIWRKRRDRMPWSMKWRNARRRNGSTKALADFVRGTAFTRGQGAERL